LDDEVRRSIFREQLKKTSRGKKQVTAKYIPKYPVGAEREYIRIINKYMAIEKQVLMKYIPELKRIISDGTSDFNADAKNRKKDNEKRRKFVRFEKVDNTLRRLQPLFESMDKELSASYGMYDLKRQLKNLSSLNTKLSTAEWKKTVHKTFGINLMEDYYSGDFYKDMIEKWIAENVKLISSVSKESLGNIKERVYRNYMEGKPPSGIVSDLQEQYGLDKRRAKLIARDQTAKLNAAITKHQQKDAGISRYEWSTCLDERVRESHAELEGKIFSWDNPPETDGGRRCHPGEDYQCRCCALPVFDIEELELPM